MNLQRRTLVIFCCLFLGAIVCVAAQENEPTGQQAAEMPVSGKYSLFDSPRIYGVQRALKVTALGKKPFLVLESPNREAEKEKPKCAMQTWVAIETLDEFKVFDSLEAADAYHNEVTKLHDD